MAASFGLSPAFVKGLTTFEIRAIITALSLLLLGIVVFGLLPSVCHIAEGRLSAAIDETTLSVPDYITSRLPKAPSAGGITAVSQVVFTAAISVFLLSVWGQYDTVVAAATTTVEYLPYLTNSLLTALLFTVAYIGAAATNEWIQDVGGQYSRIDNHQIEIVARTFQLFIIGTTTVMILAVWNINIGNILLGAGLLGVVIGFAIRETLAAVIAGFLLMFSRPFEIGDWIEIGGQTGTVTKITILNTRLRNADGERIVIPNDRVTSHTLINRSRMNRLRLRVEVGVDYDTDVDRASAIALDAVRDVEHTCEAPTPEVIPQEFGSSAITLEARFWIDDPSARESDRATAEVVQSIKQRFDEEGIEIPFPQRTVSRRATTSQAAPTGKDSEEKAE